MKKTLVFVLALSFIASSVQISANAAVKAGAACSVKGQSKSTSGMKFICVKAGKGLIWNVVPRVAKPTATPTVAPTPTASSEPTPVQRIQYMAPTNPSSNVENCKIKEVSANRSSTPVDSQLPTGFPGLTHATKTGTVKWALIPIDFPDLAGDDYLRTRVDGQMKKASDWFTTVSDGKFKVEWVVADTWVRAPKPTTEYKVERSDNIERVPNVSKFLNDAIAASDKVFDFTGVTTVNFVLPSGQNFILESAQGFPWQPEVKSIKTNEGSISSFSVAGKFFDSDRREYWSYWVHEFGHAMAIPHIGSSRIANPFLGLDIMGNQDGESRELSGWLRFVSGWLDDEKVYCKELSNLQSTDLTLVPLSGSDKGIKMVVIPTSTTKAVIIESRRENWFSCKMRSKRDGVLVYTYDATQSHGENFLAPVIPDGHDPESSSTCPVVPFPNPILYKNQKITVDGVTIEVLDSLNLDKIRISRAN